jgi:aspartate carbamoyltransferase catalytic subunit
MRWRAGCRSSACGQSTHPAKSLQLRASIAFVWHKQGYPPGELRTKRPVRAVLPIQHSVFQYACHHASELNMPSSSYRHLLTLKDMSRNRIEALLQRSEWMQTQTSDGKSLRERLKGRTVINLFFEPSTRTRSSFQLAAQRLGADVLNFDASISSTRKGETILDTFLNLQAMGADLFVIRVAESGALEDIRTHLKPQVRLINAGDGRAAHPTQGLLDMLTIRQHKGEDFSALKVLLVGDIKHSRVARSDLHALQALGAGEIRVCGPASLMPDPHELQGCTYVACLDEALQDIDVVMMLRLQRERMEEGLIASLEDYHSAFGLTPNRLKRARPDAIVTHPGPMNRGVEISDSVADGPQSVILQQVSNGVAVRMAVMDTLVNDRTWTTS